MIRSWVRAAAALAALALVTTVCAGPVAAPAGSPAASAAASATPKKGGTLVAVIGRDPATGNMDITSDTNGFFAFTPVYSSLVEIGPNGQVTPDLAKSWTVSADGKRYEFKLNAAKFHDGRPVTSADVKYTAEEVAGKYAPKFTPSYKLVDRVEAPDASTVVFTLKQPSATFLQSLAHHSIVILPQHIYAGSDPRQNPQNSKPIGSGPFKFKEWVKGDHITLERNADYFKPDVPYFDQVIFRILPDAGSRAIAFQKGDIDTLTGQLVAREQVADLKKIAGVQVNDQDDPPGEELLQFNTTKKPFNDLKVRTAFVNAIDRAAVVERAFFGQGAEIPTTHIPKQLKLFHDTTVKLPTRDVAKAGSLLDEAGYPKGANGIRLTVKLAYDQTNDADKRSAEVVRDNLKDAAVQVELQPLDSAVVAKEVYTDANFDMWTVSVTSNGDPELGIARFYTTQSIKVSFGNASRYSNPEIDQAFAQGASTTDLKERQAAYKKVQEILARDLPTLPLADYENIDFARPDIGGVTQSPIGYPYFYIQRLWRK